VEAWAERERRRRQAWLDGPSEEEKERWARRQRRRRRSHDDWDDRPVDRRRDDDDDEDDEDLRDRADRLRREAILAAEGALDYAMRWPFRAWSHLVRAGRDWEDEDFQPRRRRRISYYDD